MFAACMEGGTSVIDLGVFASNINPDDYFSKEHLGENCWDKKSFIDNTNLHKLGDSSEEN